MSSLCVSFSVSLPSISPLPSHPLSFYFLLSLPFFPVWRATGGLYFLSILKYCKDGWRTGWRGGERTRLKEGGKNGSEKKSGNGETARKRGKIGPVVVEMSATGAAEMERDG